MPSHSLEHGMEWNISEVGGDMSFVRKKSFLLLRNGRQSSVVVDHNRNRNVFLKSRFNTQTSRQERSVPADYDNPVFGMIQFGRQTE